MKKNYDKLSLWLNGILAAAHYLVGILFYKRLPDSVPLLYNFLRRTFVYGSKTILCFGIPTGFLLLFLVLTFAPQLDPRSRSYAQISQRYQTIQNIILLFFSAVYWSHLHLARGYTLAVLTLVPILGGMFLAAFGNYAVTLRPNYIVGIRTPWALNSEWNWRKTHRFAGRLWVAAGIVIILCGFLYPPAAICCLVPAILAPVIYSLALYLKQESNHTGGGES